MSVLDDSKLDDLDNEGSSDNDLCKRFVEHLSKRVIGVEDAINFIGDEMTEELLTNINMIKSSGDRARQLLEDKFNHDAWMRKRIGLMERKKLNDEVDALDQIRRDKLMRDIISKISLQGILNACLRPPNDFFAKFHAHTNITFLIQILNLPEVVLYLGKHESFWHSLETSIDELPDSDCETRCLYFRIVRAMSHYCLYTKKEYFPRNLMKTNLFSKMLDAAVRFGGEDISNLEMTLMGLLNPMSKWKETSSSIKEMIRNSGVMDALDILSDAVQTWLTITFSHPNIDIKEVPGVPYQEFKQDLARNKRKQKLSRKTCALCEKPGDDLMCCSRCLSVYYCSRRCQKKHWKISHKKACKKLMI